MSGTYIASLPRMEAVQIRAGEAEEFELQTARVMQLGKDRWSLGPAGPILRAVGMGFALGLVAMTVLTLVGGS